MPATKRSMTWFVRVDYPRSEVEKKLKTVTQWVDFEKILAVFHRGKTGENPHFHAILTLKSELQKQSIDARFKTLFEVKGSQYSSKVWDGKSGAGSYLFHEDEHDIVINRGYSDSDINEYKRLNEEVKRVVEINKERGGNKTVNRLVDKFEQNVSREQIFYELWRAIKEGEIYHPGFRMGAMIDEIFIKKSSGEDEKRARWNAWCQLAEKHGW